MGNRKIVERIRQAGAENITTSIITVAEIMRGRHEFLLKASDGLQLLRAQRLLDLSLDLLRALRILVVDTAVASVFDQLRQNNRLKKIGRADLLIACIVLTHHATLITRNVKHFRPVSALRVENWMD